MKKALRGVAWFFKNFEEIIGSACIGAMGAVTAYNVFCRYFLNKSRGWVEELAVMLLIWATFMGAAACYKRNLHVGMDFIVVRLPQKIRHWVRLGTMALLLALFVYITKIGWDFTSSITKTSTYFRLSYFYLDIAVVICFASMAIYTCVYIYWAIKEPEKFDGRFENDADNDDSVINDSSEVSK